jgi:O-antigen/teichoic acid export membrane protein
MFAFRQLGKGSLPGGVLDGFYRRAAEIARERPEALRGFLLATALRLFLVALPFGLALWFLAPHLAPWIFGNAWHEAGRMMAVMAPWMVAQMTVGSVSRVIFLSPWSWMKFIYDTLALAVASLPLALNLGSLRALMLLSWGSAVLYGVYFHVMIVAIGLGVPARTPKALDDERIQNG